MTFLPRFSARALAVLFSVSLAASFSQTTIARAESEEAEEAARMQNNVHVVNPAPGQAVQSRKIQAISTTVINFSELARQQALHPGKGPIRALDMEALDNHIDPLEPFATAAPAPEFTPLNAPAMAQVVSPSPTNSYMGLNDIPMADSMFIIIPPDCGGAVGLTKVMQGLNNNYRILDKATGAVLSTVGTATFWAPSGETDLLGLTDPRTLYDPYNNRWIAVMQTINTQNFLVGVSQTSDPSGSWFLYRFPAGGTIDFPIVGFNKNWISISINKYRNGGTFQSGINLAVDYPQARAGVGTGTLFTLANGGNFCSAPAVTYSATEDTLFVLTHISSTSGTYIIETITGTPSAPAYHLATAALTRPGGGWVQPSGNLLPQSAPNSGASACGATPCKIEVQDSQIRSAPSYRGGFLYYAQTIGLPSSGLTHTAAQWTKLNTAGGFVDGGRIDDPTATATNGGKWYDHCHIGVNAAGDLMVGYSQFSSAQHPSTGYSMHLAGDAAGTMRDPLIYKVGEDYYHKTFSTTTGRNRWGDFSQVNVDPVDDQTLWAIQEYAKTRTSTDDGNTGSNGSKWSTYWAAVAPAGAAPIVTIGPGPTQNEGNSGLTVFNFTVNLSATSASPVTVNYATANGTATVADNDYQAATSFITIPAGSTSGVIPINVVGDTKVETNETFTVTLTGATNGTLGSPVVATGTIQNDDNYIISASAGPNGSIAPSGSVSVPPGGSQAFTITPNACFHIADVLVDGSSVGAVTNFTFNAVAANHTIAASFAINTFTITASAGSGGSIAPSGPVVVNCGFTQGFTITPDATHTIADVLVDGSSVGAVSSFSFTNVTAAHTIAASFAAITFTINASAGTGGSITPSGPVVVNSGADQAFTIAPGPCFHIADVLVDGVSQGAITTFTFSAVSAAHTIAASFGPDRTLSIGSVIAPEGNAGTTNFDFPVTLSGPCSQEVDVTWKTVDGTALRSDSDYAPDSTVLALAPNATSGVITVHVNGDLTPEDTETFFVDLLNPVNAGIAKVEGQATILNDDGVSAAEGTSLKNVSFAIQGNPSGTIAFRLGIPAPTRADLAVYDISGRRVAALLQGTVVGTGYHTVRWDPRDTKALPGSGVYFVRFRADGQTFVRRFVLLR
jgi:hypothetical protein